MIGVAGCGRMGAPMLAALRAAGLDAGGFDIRPWSEFELLTPVMTSDAADFAARITTLISVVRDTTQTDDVLIGRQGFALAPNLTRILICSTLSPRYVLSLRDRVPDHITLIDAPMSGAQIAAQEARLSFMLGGAPAELDAAQPILSAMGEYFHRMGPFGSGMQAKVLNNLLAAGSTAMTRLVLDWGDKTGLDEAALLKLISTSSGQNWLASGFDDIEFARDGHADDNTIGILVKDIDSALDAAPADADQSLPHSVRAILKSMQPRTR